MPYPDVLLPVYRDYTIIEAAVVEAAHAGCDTIWIVCNDDIAPIVRHRIGDYIQDPIHFYNKYQNHMKDRRIRIPIFWVPIHPKDRDKRDCLSWSVIHGALTSLKTSGRISKWLNPDKYYVSFPYGIFDPRVLKNHRRAIKSKKNFYISSNNKTVEDNRYTSFTFGKEEFITYRRNVRKGTGQYSTKETDHRGIPRSRLPIEERWSARFFELKDVFFGARTNDDSVLEIEQFYDIDNWDNYRKFLSSPLGNSIKRPSRELFSYREFNRIATDRD